MAKRTAQLLRELGERARDPERRIDGGARGSLAAPATAADIAATEETLDFALPALLAEAYCSIANGGFGPGYGLIGTPGGAVDPRGHSMVDLYDSFSAVDTDSADWRWPERLLPVASFGEAFYACADCTQPGSPIFCYDATAWTPGAELVSALVPQRPSLETWLQDWAAGCDLFRETFALETGDR